MVLRVIHSVVVHVADVETPIIIHDFGGAHLSQVGIEFLRNKMADKMLRFISKFVNT